jgi:hypothetical protein
MLLTDVPEDMLGRGIEPPARAHGFSLSLDTAEPWGGGTVEGRVEARESSHKGGAVTVSVRCCSAWLDLPPQLVGQKPFWRIGTYWDLRTRALPIWIEEEVWLERWELGDLSQTNWLHFGMTLPPELPRAFEGTFAAFRWRVSASRPRRIGHDTASLPLILLEPRTEPIVRLETSPLGAWRLLEWRAEGEREAAGGQCSVAYEPRRPEDMPLPGETRQQELARRAAR